MSTKQSPTSKKDREITSIGDSRRTMAGHQYRHDRTTTQIKRNGCHSSNHGLIHEDD